MTRARLDGFLLLVFGAVIFVWLGAFLEHTKPGPMTDFKGYYYSGRCLLQHCDPYNESELQRLYLHEVRGHPTEPPQLRRVVTILVNVPTAFTFVVPVSLFPWGPAHVLWFILTAGSLILATFLAWDLGADYAPRISGLLLGLVLATSAWLLANCNAAGIVVGLAVIAVWCLLRERFMLMGVLCLAASLAIKPHDAGLVWLYFLLAGGAHRKRALQTLFVAIALGLPGLLLVWHASPHWMTELHSNLARFSAPGGIGDPGPASVTGRDPDSIINLQTVTSVFYDNPRIYNPLSNLLSGALVLLWIVTILKSKSSWVKDRLALAAIAALSLPLAFHRQHDAKILLLTFPAFGMLWADGGPIGWSALALTVVGILLNGDLTSFVRISLTKNIPAHPTSLTGEISTILFVRPIPLLLIITGLFYLWVYVRQARLPCSSDGTEDTAQGPLLPALHDPASPSSALN